MLKFMFMILFLIPVCFFIDCWWVVQSLMYFMTFMFFGGLVMSGGYSNLSYFFGCDVLSYGLIMLSLWICALMVTASESIYRTSFHSQLFQAYVLFLLLMLYCTFSSMSMFSFYVFFEGSLIPTLLLILGWGYQPERLQAGVYLLFYTLLASLPLLIGLFNVYSLFGSLDLSMFSTISVWNVLFYMVLILAFLVKVPMFLVHLWLPSAHVEAPVSGSMILAGVLLKLGGYGLLRVYSMMVSLGLKYNYIWIAISLVGGVMVGCICLCQSDVKALIAYSSVSHMGVMLSGMMTMTVWGASSGFVLMIAHGLCSAGLFALANITYERLGSRSMLVSKGLMNFMPSMAMWWFLLSSSNMAAPPSLNLMGEIGLFNSLVAWSWITMFTLMLLSFFSAVYTLYLYSYSQHGMLYSGIYSCSSGYGREFILLLLHWLPLNILVLKGDLCILWL